MDFMEAGPSTSTRDSDFDTKQYTDDKLGSAAESTIFD